MSSRVLAHRPSRPARFALLAAAAITLIPFPALAAGIDGQRLGLGWSLPFAGLLLSVAVLPQLAHHFWDRHMGALAGGWAACALLPLALLFGWGAAGEAVLHTALAEYVPFCLLLLALYTIAGGILVEGDLKGSPAINTGILAFGTLLASVVGTTGAAMILIRPLLRANDERRHNAHVVVFFIFLVANIGGALSPLGDPPLFLGYLRGVEFFWPLRHLWPETLTAVGLVLAVFFVLDRTVYGNDSHRPPRPDPTTGNPRLRVRGAANLILLLALVGVVAASGAWRPAWAVTIGGTTVGLAAILRDGGLLLLTGASLILTPKRNRALNDFSWRPIVEVAKIFAGVFACLIPVSAALAAGHEGAFGPLLALVSRADGTPNPLSYFWLTGLLSSVLDNAPTYLVFFDLAGGDPARLMGQDAATLAAVSTGAVFMGAMTYLGNAPNFMVYAIARAGGVTMPGFIGYLGWSAAILGPVFAVVSLVFLL